MAFKQAAQGTPATSSEERVKGFVEVAEDELCRYKSMDDELSRGRTARQSRANEAVQMARQFEQVAVESAARLEAALHHQE